MPLIPIRVRRSALAAILLLVPPSSLARGADRTDADAPAPVSAALADVLVSEGMPELVEELVRSGTPAHQVLLARAAARAAEIVRDPARREADLERAMSAYRKALTTESDPEWSGVARRRLAIAGWRTELADLTLRKLCAADLDEFEACSGLKPPPPRLAQRLAMAIREYRLADATIKEFTAVLARDEDALLMEGVTRSVAELGRSASLNLAWALVYRAMTVGPQDAERSEDLQEALRRFDAVGREAGDAAERLSAALGAGIAFRESNRPQDAQPILEGIVRSATSGETRVRARFELGRTAMKSQDYEAAARLFDELAAQPTSAPTDGDGGFYRRLAPVLSAYCRLLQSQARSDDGAAALRKGAIETLVGRRAVDPAWASVVDVYLNQVVPVDANPAALDGDDQLALGRRLAAIGELPRAIAAYEAFLSRPGSGESTDRDAARYELARCLRQTGQLRQAARLLAELADKSTQAALARTAVDDLVETWQSIVTASALRDDELQLARACLRAAAQASDARIADERILRAAQSFERAGRVDEALAAYARIDPASARHLAARFGAIRCRQSAYEQRETSMQASEAARLAGALVREWNELADQLRRGAGGGLPESEELRGMHDQARLNAANLMAGPRLQQYAEAISGLDGIDRSDLPAGAAVRLIAIRLRCYRELKRFDECDQTARRLVECAKAMPPGPGLVAAAAELEAEVERRGGSSAVDEASPLAVESVPVIGRLLDSVLADPARSADVPVVQFSMARMLVAAGRASDALPTLDQLVAGDPSNRAYLRYRALALEQQARNGRAEAEWKRKAESAWSKLLEDRTLRESAPPCYWEARYYWLRWQLDAGRAAEVATGIDSERAWYPDLGGPPWNAKLLELADRARTVARR